ncbi:MAG TPA: hypothetical protein VFK69_01950, partial [Candidatus Eisenbacteria bacterium]|nr:hypothetical protein [Candidatus Eisenbacteria bacterium]
ARRHRAAYALAGVALVAVAWLLPWRGRGPQAPGTRIMVAPLDARGAGGDAPYIGEAFARTMTQDLARARPLTVVPVGSTPPAALRDARVRGAQWLVSGRLVRTGEFVRVSLDLTDVRNGKLQWSDVAQGLDTELSGMASRLAARVAGALHARTEPQYDYYMSSVPNPSLASSPLVSEALGAVRRFDSATALASTARLVREFPDAPEARVLRTWAWMHAGWDEGVHAPTKAEFEASLDTLRRVDPGNPWADVFAATVRGREGRNESAVEAFSRVLERNDLTPGARAHILALRGQSERELGDSTAALLDLETALRLDGLDVVTLVILSDALGTFGRPAEALLRARQALALSPDMGFANWILAQACGRLNDWAGAVDAAHRAATTQPRQEFFAFEALALEHAGRSADASRVEREALSHPENDWGDEYLARRHALRGEREQGLRLLARSVELGWKDPETATLPEFAALRDDPRFQAILARVRPAPAHLAARGR